MGILQRYDDESDRLKPVRAGTGAVWRYDESSESISDSECLRSKLGSWVDISFWVDSPFSTTLPLPYIRYSLGRLAVRHLLHPLVTLVLQSPLGRWLWNLALCNHCMIGERLWMNHHFRKMGWTLIAWNNYWRMGRAIASLGAVYRTNFFWRYASVFGRCPNKIKMRCCGLCKQERSTNGLVDWRCGASSLFKCVWFSLMSNVFSLVSLFLLLTQYQPPKVIRFVALPGLDFWALANNGCKELARDFGA